jgi:hypothetical protein
MMRRRVYHRSPYLVRYIRRVTRMGTLGREAELIRSGHHYGDRVRLVREIHRLAKDIA